MLKWHKLTLSSLEHTPCDLHTCANWNCCCCCCYCSWLLLSVVFTLFSTLGSILTLLSISLATYLFFVFFCCCFSLATISFNNNSAVQHCLIGFSDLCGSLPAIGGQQFPAVIIFITVEFSFSSLRLYNGELPFLLLFSSPFCGQPLIEHKSWASLCVCVCFASVIFIFVFLFAHCLL